MAKLQIMLSKYPAEISDADTVGPDVGMRRKPRF